MGRARTEKGRVIDAAFRQEAVSVIAVLLRGDLVDRIWWSPTFESGNDVVSGTMLDREPDAGDRRADMRRQKCLAAP